LYTYRFLTCYPHFLGEEEGGRDRTGSPSHGCNINTISYQVNHPTFFVVKGLSQETATGKSVSTFKNRFHDCKLFVSIAINEKGEEFVSE
jgi:hypothetical protein